MQELREAVKVGKSIRIDQSKLKVAQTQNDDNGMTLEQVARRIGLEYTRLVSTRKRLGGADSEKFLAYLEEKSGIRWKYETGSGRYGKYYV